MKVDVADAGKETDEARNATTNKNGKRNRAR
jgi:hypothetical protein